MTHPYFERLRLFHAHLPPNWLHSASSPSRMLTFAHHSPFLKFIYSRASFFICTFFNTTSLASVRTLFKDFHALARVSPRREHPRTQAHLGETTRPDPPEQLGIVMCGVHFRSSAWCVFASKRPAHKLRLLLIIQDFFESTGGPTRKRYLPARTIGKKNVKLGRPVVPRCCLLTPGCVPQVYIVCFDVHNLGLKSDSCLPKAALQ